jgi:probable addiction module antidote protein
LALARGRRFITPTSKTGTPLWDPARYLEARDDVVAYLDAALEEAPALLAPALGDVARAKGMTEIARETGLGRESLYKALSSDGNPELGTILKVVRALGLKLRVTV